MGLWLSRSHKARTNSNSDYGFWLEWIKIKRSQWITWQKKLSKNTTQGIKQ